MKRWNKEKTIHDECGDDIISQQCNHKYNISDLVSSTRNVIRDFTYLITFICEETQYLQFYFSL